jgi:hypothetical protein
LGYKGYCVVCGCFWFCGEFGCGVFFTCFCIFFRLFIDGVREIKEVRLVFSGFFGVFMWVCSVDFVGM